MAFLSEIMVSYIVGFHYINLMERLCFRGKTVTSELTTSRVLFVAAMELWRVVGLCMALLPKADLLCHCA